MHKLTGIVLAVAVIMAACTTTTSADRAPAEQVEPAPSTNATAAPSTTMPDTTTSMPDTTTSAVPPFGTLGAGTRDNPIALDSLAPVGDWLVRVVDVEPNANGIVAAASEFNEPPPDGRQYFLIEVEATYAGDDSSSFWVDTFWSAVGAAAVAYDAFEDGCGTLERDLTYAGEVWPGGTVAGEVCFAVTTEDADELQLIIDQGFGGEGRTIFALQEGIGEPLKIELPEPPPVVVDGEPGSRGNPVALGALARLGDWYVRVLDADVDATERVVADGFFNEPPQPGHQFVLADVEVAYFGDEAGQSAGSLQFRMLGPGNVAVDGWNASCGFLTDDVSSAGELYPGGMVSGSVCLQVPADQVEDLRLIVDTFGFSDERQFFALEPGAGEDPGEALPEPPAVAAGALGSWTNPHAAGAVVQVGEWNVRVVDADLDATDTVLAESEFNDPPPDGYQHALVTLEAEYAGPTSGSFWSELSWGLLGNARVAYSEFASGCGLVPNSIADTPEVFPGGVVTGNVCLTLPTAEASGAVLILEDFLSFSEKVFVALP